MTQWYDHDYLTIAHGTGIATLQLHSYRSAETVRIGRMVRDSSADCPTCGARRRTVYRVTLHDGTVEQVIGRQAAMDRLVTAWRTRPQPEETTS